MSTVRRSLTVLSPELPHSHVAHAGGRYVGRLVEELEKHFDVVVVVPDTPGNREAAQRPGTPTRSVVAGSRATRPRWSRPAFRVTALLDTVRTRRDPSVPSLVQTLSLLLDPRARRAIRRADVIDLQWSQGARLEPLVRLLNRRAVVVGTFHDVRSQAFERAASATNDEGARTALARAARSERRAERRLVDRLDRAITFSGKDASLLSPDGDRVVVLEPPLYGDTSSARRPARSPLVLFVAHLARPENIEGLGWLLDDVWPRVRGAMPSATLRIVGAGAPDSLATRLRHEVGVEASGFVDDLAGEYATARLVVVPVRRGAGVKFKTVEALVAGVPTVTTSVGAEGIEGADLFAAVTDEAADFAAACVAVLEDPATAESHADRAARSTRWTYSTTRFADGVRRLYIEV